MRAFFEPDTVALIGASSTPGRSGHHLFKNIYSSYGNDFYPVNPGIDSINGVKCYPTILDVPADIDLAVVFVPAKIIPQILKRCVEKGVKHVLIESSGFTEIGEAGRVINDQCLEIARNGGIRIWGPNCMGLLNISRKKILSFMSGPWEEQFFPGPISLIVQSGNLTAGFLLSILNDTPFGISKLCSIGNKMDIDESDVLEYLIDDPETGVVGLYLESINRGRKLFELCKSTEKQIIVLKSGSTEMGADAAMSHTASLAQNHLIVEKALQQAGAIVVDDMNDLVDIARSFSVVPVRKKTSGRIGIASYSGGTGVVTTDSLIENGMQLATFSDSTINRMKGLCPDWMTPSNPCDMYPAIEINGFRNVTQNCLEAILSDPGIDGAFLHLWQWSETEPLFDYDKIGEMIREYEKHLVVWLLAVDGISPKVRKDIEGRGILVVNNIKMGVRALEALTLHK
ncbi:MAG: hypothetical protein HN737_14190 [Desulfobacterales bacterium]|jgi:acetate---CoA ligase (ADP-forming)|nr:hypothetical protein [Desulfobacteraceae bacterium]MBT7084908.1 hypothetical protein [Desulfobacterales bacterium]MBT7698546.1 hypothetical protein [Desulfobacterales bacterium]